MKKKILFIGAYGIENAGDDLPMLVMIDNLKKIAPKIEFEFHALTRHINKWEQEKYGVIYHQNLEYESREESKGKWFRGLNYDDDREVFNDFTALIKSMDLLIIGAGNFIIDISIDIFKGPIPLIWWYIHLAKLYEKKVFLYGISTAPLKNEYSQLLTKEIMAKSDIVTVRDNASKQYLKSLNINKEIIVLPDPTLGGETELTDLNFLHSKDKSILNNSDHLKIALGLRSLGFLQDKGKKVYGDIINFINNNPNYSYVFVPQSTYFEDNDIELAKEISKSIDNKIQVKIIESRYTPKELIHIYSSCDITIAIRLHSAVFSQIAETPAIAINYLPKVKAYMKDFGTLNQTININELSAQELTAKVSELKNNEFINSLLINKKAEKKVEVEKYAKLALSLLVKEID